MRDRESHTVMELGQLDFQVFEDGRLQAIRPFRHEAVGLVIDHSGMHPQLGPEIANARPQ